MTEDRGYEIEIVNGDKKTVITVNGDEAFDITLGLRTTLKEKGVKHTVYSVELVRDRVGAMGVF